MKRLLLVVFYFCYSLNSNGQIFYATESYFKNITLFDNQDSISLKEYKKQNFFLFLYKKFVSSQDGQSCAFTPSCSVYASESIKKKGLFFGVLNTFDRLSRCNSPQHHLYSRDEKSQLLFDPVE